MALPSPRCLEAVRASPRPALPRFYSADAGASKDMTSDSCTGLETLQSRLEAVDRDSARRKFARYGRQHAHVDHLSGMNQDTGIVLQSSLVLQEDGRLATRLDDLMYLLDGLLGPRGRLTQNSSMLDLLDLIQDPTIFQVVELSGQRRSIQSKIKQLLLTRLGQRRVGHDETFCLSLAVLVYFLSKSPSAEEYFNHKVLNALVNALKQEVETMDEIKETEDSKAMDASVSGSTPPICALEKKCLKRKQTLCQQRSKPEENATGAFPCADRVSVVSLPLTTSTVQLLDEFYWIKLDKLLRDQESFYVEGKLHVSVVSVLSAALHILLQVGGHSSTFSSDLAQRYQREVSPQSGSAAEDTFRLIQARKCQLVRNGGIDVLVRGLSQRLNSLETLLPLAPLEAITLECAHVLHSVSMLLGVFDQVTFLTLDVQQYMSKKKHVFALLLKLIQLLSELGWGIHARQRWEAELTRMLLVVEVLLSALRVLINLTHHNLEAASHVFALNGMQLLRASFFQLRGLVVTAEKSSVPSSATNKWEFDACLLLLSVMINSIEFSEENRDALASALVCQVELARDAFDLFTRFFLDKLQSYRHLIDLTETQGASEAISIEDQGDDWNPEDVILGGCTSLLLGYLMKGSPTNRTTILAFMPECSPRLLLRALSVFTAFHLQIDALTPEVAKSVLDVEKILSSCRRNERDADQRDRLTGVAAKPYPGAFDWRYDSPISLDSVPAAKSKEADINLSSMLVIEKSVECESSDILPPSQRIRSLRNVCSNLDDSDEDCEPHRQARYSVVSTKLAGASSQDLQAIGTHASTHTPPRTQCRKRPQVEGFEKASPASQTSTRRPPRANRSSSITAVRPDGSLSSPVVARLLKRTRELVKEFDVEFATLNHSMHEKEAENSNKIGADSVRSSCMTLTMNVTCGDIGSDGLDVSPDLHVENCNVRSTTKIAAQLDIRPGTSSQQKPKIPRNSDGLAKSAVGYEKFSLEFEPKDILLSTPLRTQKHKTLLRTPTKDRHSPGFYRASPSLILTPTKTTPSTPLRLNKYAGLLRTSKKSRHSPIFNQSPLSVSPHRRKAKVARAPPSARSSSIFDFTA